MTDKLTEICDVKRIEVAARKQATSLADLDSRAAERVEEVVELVGRGDFGRQQLVDLVVEQIALFLADGDELPDFVVFFFDRQVRVLQCARGRCPARCTTPVALLTGPVRAYVSSSIR